MANLSIGDNSVTCELVYEYAAVDGCLDQFDKVLVKGFKVNLTSRCSAFLVLTDLIT